LARNNIITWLEFIDNEYPTAFIHNTGFIPGMFQPQGAIINGKKKPYLVRWNVLNNNLKITRIKWWIKNNMSCLRILQINICGPWK
jgi:hypothetical protein